MSDEVAHATPFPGSEVLDPEKQNAITRFDSVFGVHRGGTKPFNIPNACLIEGEPAQNFWESSEFLNRDRLFLFVENHPTILMTCMPREVRVYFASKELWEDYDICIFDETMTFCYAASHEDRFVLTRVKEDLKT